MGCLKIPTVALPPLPLPFSIPPITIPLPGTPELQLCCRLPPFQLPPIPVPIPLISITLIPGVVDAVTAGIDLVTEYINKIPLKCPLE